MPDPKEIEGAEGAEDAQPVEKHLKLGAVHLDPLLAARIAERTAKIQANDAERRKLRATALGPAGAADAAKAQTDLTAASTAAAVAHANYGNAMALAKAAHDAEENYAEELFDLGRGVLILREQAETQVRGLPPVERKRIKIDDKECDLYATSYALSCTASDEATDLARQVEDYKAAHPALFAAGPGEPPPVDPVFEALKTALADKAALVQSEQAKQGAIVQKVLGGEVVGYYMRVDIAAGEIVLGDKDKG